MNSENTKAENTAKEDTQVRHAVNLLHHLAEFCLQINGDILVHVIQRTGNHCSLTYNTVTIESWLTICELTF